MPLDLFDFIDLEITTDFDTGERPTGRVLYFLIIDKEPGDRFIIYCDTLNSVSNNVIAIDFFCGAGGLTFGLRRAGIKVLKGVDNDASVEKTYTENNLGSVFIKKDIREITSKELMKNIDRRGKKLLFAGCAPCQPFSRQNRKSGRDNRRSLIRAFARLVKEVIPEYVMVENVPGFMKNSNVHREFLLEILKNLGYKFDEGVLDASEYGVPQKRKRYVLLASLGGEIKLPEGTYGKGKLPLATVRDAILKYPPIKAGESHVSIPNHSSRCLSETNLIRIRKIPKNGGSRSSLPKELRLSCHSKHNGHKDVYGRMSWDRPSPTLTCKCYSFTNGRFGHPEQDRAISFREAAALQTFPDNYVFHGNKTDVSKFIGNAVPIIFAQFIGNQIVKNGD